MKEFIELFTGLQRAYGQFVIKEQTGHKKVKVEGRATTITKQITQAVYKNHLNGKTGLGIVPIWDDNTCLFGCIDIDEYNDKEQEFFIALYHKIITYRLPLVLCRSKSGGAHVYLFAADPIPANLLRNRLQKFTNILGYPDTEIFPKQEKLDPADNGNWINLPYFNAKQTSRFGMVVKGNKLLPLTLDGFVKYCQSKRISKKDLQQFQIQYEDYPPCLQALFIEGFPDHDRNIGLFNVAVLMRKMGIPNWKDRLQDFNRQFVNLPNAEIERTILKQKKDYFYQCHEGLLRSRCNKTECVKRKYGIGSGDHNLLNFSSMQMIQTDPPTWYLMVDGARLELTTDDLMNQQNFKRVCINQLQKIPPKVKGDEWDKIVADGIAAAEKIQAPPDAGPVGTFIDIVEDFCLNRAPSKERDGLLRDQPWSNNGWTYFRSGALKRYLKGKKFFDFSSRQIWNALREFLKGESTVLNIKGKSTFVWRIKAFEQQTEKFDTPKQEEEPF